MMNIPDHPVIANMERTGHPDGREPKPPRCPVCDKEFETLYKDRYGDVVGCDCCMTTVDAWDYEEGS